MQYIPFPERDVLQESEAKREKGFNKRKMVSSVECSIAGRRVGLEKKKSQEIWKLVSLILWQGQFQWRRYVWMWGRE